MKPAAIFVVLVTLHGASAAQVRTDFSGRWRLIEPRDPSADIAKELLVRDFDVPPRLGVEQRLTTGVGSARFTIADSDAAATAVHPDPGYPGIAIRRVATLLLKSGGAVQMIRGSNATHEEAWSIGGDDFLVVVVTDQPLGAAPSTLRLRYQRVPRLASAIPGQNLLENANADKGQEFWFRLGNATVEECDGNPCFAVRSGAQFLQTVILPSDVGGRYVVLIGSGAAERLNPDGGITGLPSLYATVGSSDGVHIVGYLQGQGLLGRSTQSNEWVTLWGMFQMPADADQLSVQLKQASARGVPQDGSAARFDNLGVFVFPTIDDARAFIESWRGR